MWRDHLLLFFLPSTLGMLTVCWCEYSSPRTTSGTNGRNAAGTWQYPQRTPKYCESKVSAVQNLDKLRVHQVFFCPKCFTLRTPSRYWEHVWEVFLMRVCTYRRTRVYRCTRTYKMSFIFRCLRVPATRCGIFRRRPWAPSRCRSCWLGWLGTCA